MIRMRHLLSRIEKIERYLRHSFVSFLTSTHLFVAFKSIKKIDFLVEVCKSLKSSHTSYVLVGGFAIDALRGQITRDHADVDIAFLEENGDTIVYSLQRNGFRIERKSPFIRVAKKSGMHVDLYEWKQRNDELVEYMMYDVMVRIPRHFIEEKQFVFFQGIRLPVASKAFLISLLPFMSHEKDKQFVNILNASLKLEFSQFQEDVFMSMHARIYECNNEHRNST